MIAGITGHQDLGDKETISWIKDCLTKEIQKYNVTEGLTCLAIGADQLFADILDKFNIRYTAVIPSDNYEDTFDPNTALANYRLRLSNAKKSIKLDFPNPCEEAYYEAGKYIVDHSEIVFAIWNRKPAKGLGGTGDVVKYALDKNRIIIHINPISREVQILK